MIQAIFSGETISSASNEAFTLHEKSCFGEKKLNRIEYSLIEALFLVQENKMQIYSSSNKQLSKEKLLKKAKKIDKKIEVKLIVFSDLRKRGYIPKTALKFGAEFRVYDKGDKPKTNHAKWLCFIIKESDTLQWYDFAAKNRIAHSTKKLLLIAIVDEESDITYYEVSWLRP